MKDGHMSVLFLFAGFTLCSGFLDTSIFRCGVTEWSAWNKPYIYGMMYRERKVLEHPPEGDDICMDRLYEVKLDPDSNFSSNRHLPLDIRVNLIIDHFLRRSRPITSKRGTTPTKDIRDLVLIVDASGSVGYAFFKKSLFELTALLSAICPSPDPFNVKYNHAAMLVFSSNVYEIFDFNDYSNTTLLFDAIRNTRYTTGGTHTGEAFEHALQQTLTARKGLRHDPNIKREVLILTDGLSNGPKNAVQEARKLHNVAEVFGLVIGNPQSTGQKEIRAYMSNKIPNHLFAASSFQDLSILISATLQKLKSKPDSNFSSKRHLPLDIRVNLIIDNFLRRSRPITSKRGTTPTKDIRDLVLIVDASGSVGYAFFKKSLFELTALLSAICPSPDPFNVKYNHAAMLVFSSNVYEIFDFNDYSNTTLLFDAIRNTRYTTGGTHTGEAFEHALQQTLTARKGLRRDPNIKREVLILTDGLSNGPKNAVQEARKLHNVAEVFGLVIGIPQSTGQKEIRAYTSNKIPNHLFAASSFQDLSTLISATLQKLKSKPGLSCLNASP